MHISLRTTSSCLFIPRVFYQIFYIIENESAARSARSKCIEHRSSKRDSSVIVYLSRASGGGGFLAREYDGIFRGWLLYYQRAALNLWIPRPHTRRRPRGASLSLSRRDPPSPPGSRVVAGHNTLCLPKAVSGRLVLARVKLLENQLLLRYCL